MLQEFDPGDVLVFQLESGYGMLRVLAVDHIDGKDIWHVAAYDDLFIDVDSAEAALGDVSRLKVGSPHIALTNRAFESTQVARITNIPLTESETATLSSWRSDPNREISDRSVRLMLGLR
jgi:hypothetical protein